MKDGSILSADRNSHLNIGVQCVVFKVRGDRMVEDNFSYLFCGVMSYFTNVRETVVIDGVQRQVFSFKLCEASCTSDLVGQCNWLWG